MPDLPLISQSQTLTTYWLSRSRVLLPPPQRYSASAARRPLQFWRPLLVSSSRGLTGDQTHLYTVTIVLKLLTFLPQPSKTESLAPKDPSSPLWARYYWRSGVGLPWECGATLSSECRTLISGNLLKATSIKFTCRPTSTCTHSIGQGLLDNKFDRWSK